MLSTKTLAFLEELCKKSHDAWREGGTLWTYVEAANQAHSRFNDPRRKLEASPLNVEQLARWLQAAQGDLEEALAPSSVSASEELLGLLQTDLNVDKFLWNFEDGGHDMRADILMERSSDNRYFALELWWSVD